MPVSVFDEQMDQLRGLGYTVVDLQAVLAHYVDGIPLPPKAVLITFDDGYHDNLANAAEVLKRYGYPAVLFVPIGYLDDRQPLPHEERLAAQGILNRTIDWEEMADLERAGIRIESHGISHRPLADLELDEAAREIALSKLRLEERLDRPVRAFSYVKGSEAHCRVGIELAEDRSAAAAPLQHRALLAAYVRARARGRLRPDLREGHGHGDARATPVQRGARHVDEVMTFDLSAYEPAQREDYLRLLQAAWGEFALTGPEFDWWFRDNPAGSLMSVARTHGRVVGVAAHSLFRMMLAGDERLASFSVHATTAADARGQGIFEALERISEQQQIPYKPEGSDAKREQQEHGPDDRR